MRSRLGRACFIAPPRGNEVLEADRVFLADFMNLTFKSHMMAVEALLQARGRAKEYAALYLRHEDPKLGEAASVALEAQTNEGARFQGTMFAKIYAEFVGAVEDFGAAVLRHPAS